MCTNYRAPGEESGLSELRIDSFVDLYRWTPWKPEIYQDYDAPIVASIDGQFTPLIAGFGFWPRALQKANAETAKEQGRKPPIMRSTMNVRDDNLGKSPLYAPAWPGSVSQPGRRVASAFLRLNRTSAHPPHSISSTAPSNRNHAFSFKPHISHLPAPHRGILASTHLNARRRSHGKRVGENYFQSREFAG
ncbi:hypothetical protein [Burkholderia sp. Bp9031]|uniref:hypothetical protein n=1 Tax=Burkholderia sp. Bp9031 TaxID=2184566 RepID=UPI0021AB8649|nr:hypothetical protein [Burkholderia sp. Bp9031]